jgi:PAP2 superfamily
MTTNPIMQVENVAREDRRDTAMLRWALSLLAIAGVAWVASRKTFFDDSISSVFLSVALFSIFLILVRTRFSWKEIAGVAAGAGLLCWLDIGLLGFRYNWPVGVSCVGLAALAVLALRAIWAEGAERGTAVLTVSAAFLFVASEWFAGYFLAWGELARPKVLDLFLYAFDASLGVQPAVVLGQMFARFPWFAAISQIVYLALPVAIGLAFAGCVVKARDKAAAAVVAFLITGPIGACFYTMFPALGPAHILHANFPWHSLTMEQAKRLALEPIVVAGPRNAIPSLHAAWIFLVFWFCRRLSVAERIAAGFFVFFTLCGTLGTGEHYFIDLVVAAPFSVLILAVTQGLCRKWKQAYWAPLLGGLGLTLAWFGLLRYATPVFRVSPVIPWAACGATVLGCWYLLGAWRGEAGGVEGA